MADASTSLPLLARGGKVLIRKGGKGAMAGFESDTGDITRKYCPSCEPKTDPIEELVVVVWCGQHKPSIGGLDDYKIEPRRLYFSRIEAGGETNRAFTELLRRLFRRPWD